MLIQYCIHETLCCVDHAFLSLSIRNLIEGASLLFFTLYRTDKLNIVSATRVFNNQDSNYCSVQILINEYTTIWYANWKCFIVIQ